MEMEIAGAADKLETMMNSSQPQANIFFQPNSLGALPSLCLQAKLTISMKSIQDKFAGGGQDHERASKRPPQSNGK